MSTQNTTDGNAALNRREFITTTATLVGSAALLASPVLGSATGLFCPVIAVTVGQIMDAFIKEVSGAPFPNTVDTLKSGSRDTVVTGIITTMFATIDLIRKAAEMNVNFIIAHEPTFYNHADATQWLEGDDVYQYKVDLLKKHGITVWRNHDDVHSLKVDGVRKGVVEQLGWRAYGKPDQPIYNLVPGMSLKNLIGHCKTRLNIQHVRYIGGLEQVCKKVLLMPGAAGGTRQITALMKNQPDVLVTGEISEWETAEYVRDARSKGKQLALIVLGHIASEEPGSAYMATWLKANFPAVKTTHIPPGNSLLFL